MSKTQDQKESQKPKLENDPIDEASKESFPASDAPSWIDSDKKEKDVSH